MATHGQWEYRVLTIGGWTGFNNKAAETALNELGQESWEVVSGAMDNAGRLVVVAKRPVTQATRRRRSYPGEE